MSTDATLLFDAALKLSESDRAELVFRLLRTLPPPGSPTESMPGLTEVLQSRLDEYREHPETASDWEASAERIRKALPPRDHE